MKARAGLLHAPPPSKRPFAGATALLSHRALAREAVRRSLVLLKNDGGGPAAAPRPTNADFPNGP